MLIKTAKDVKSELQKSGFCPTCNAVYPHLFLVLKTVPNVSQSLGFVCPYCEKVNVALKRSLVTGKILGRYLRPGSYMIEKSQKTIEIDHEQKVTEVDAVKDAAGV